MEYLNSFNTLRAVKMLVLSNISRASLPQKPFVPTLDVGAAKKQRRHSFRERLRPKLNSNRVHNDPNENAKMTQEKLLHSNSVDAIVARKNEIETKVMRSAKGVLETNLDDLFSDQDLKWSSTDLPSETKTLGASEPVLSCAAQIAGNCDSVQRDYDSDEDTTDSDDLDEVVREQRRCLGASRFGKILRRVISRNGKNLAYIGFQLFLCHLRHILRIRRQTGGLDT